jgi:hypothetical protein
MLAATYFRDQARKQELQQNMLRSVIRLFSAVILFALLTSASALAQSGRFTGQVTDQEGGAIPGATVQVVNQTTLVKRETKTDGAGAYAVPSLPPGQYQVIVEAEGFGRRSSEIVTLIAGQDFVFSSQMSVGGVKTEVDVSTGGETVETESATVSTTLSEKEVTGYGLNGRNFSQLITMAPGVSNQTGQDEAKVGVAGSSKFSVNGGRVEYNTFDVDGSDVLNTSINSSRGQGQPLMVYPSIDAIQEMKVLTANYSALYGKSASGSVLVTTKSGTEKFHGNVYGFIRNEMFNARNYFDAAEPTPLANQNTKLVYRTPLYRRLDFGATIGGPLFIPKIFNTDKSKTFFFFSEEIRREKTPVPYNQAVPTMAERSGNFSDVCPAQVPNGSLTFTPADYPDCPIGVGVVGGDAPGRAVNVNYTSAALLASGTIPAPNSASGCNSTNPSPLPHCYTGSVSPPTHWREELFRIDHNLTSNERLSFRYVHDSWDTVTLTPQWGIVQNSFPTVENQLNGPGLNMVLSLAQTLPREFINRIAFSYAVEHISLAPQPGPGVSSLARPVILDDPASLGGTPVPGSPLCTQVTNAAGSTTTQCPIGQIFNNGFNGNKMPGLTFQGTNGAYGGHGFAVDTGYAPWNQANPTYGLRDDASKTWGKHTLQFGLEATLVQQNELSAVTGANSGDLQGLLAFSNQQSIYTTGNAFADFLGGSAIKSYTQDSGQAKYYNRYKAVDLYLQDDWHLHSRLTVNVGLRASLLGPWYNAKNSAYNWRPEIYNPSLGGSVYVDQTNGFLVRKNSGSPVPLDSGNLDKTITNGLVQCGVNGLSSGCMTNSIFHPSPRVGFSWDPWGDGKTAVRAGYGLFWEHGTGYEANVGSLIGSAPTVLSETQSNVPGSYGLLGFSCQQGAAQCGTQIQSAGGVTFPLNVTSIPTKAVYSYTQQWSLSVQREVRKGMVGQLAYVGTKGTHLTGVRDLNQLAPISNGLNPFSAGQPITSDVCMSGANSGVFSVGGINGVGQGAGISIPSSPGIGPNNAGFTNMTVACTGNSGFVRGLGTSAKQLGISADDVRPYPGFSNIISVENVAESQYHALQATLRETTGPVTIGVAYTYSHSIDDASDRSSANFANSLDIRSNRASSDFDQRHLLNISYIYDLPLLHLLQGFTHLLGTGSDVEDDGISSHPSNPAPGQLAPIWGTLIGGWQLSGITTFQTGTPFSVVNGGGSNGTGAADNAGVGDGLGVGSYADIAGNAHSQKPNVAAGGDNVGPLLLNPSAFTAPRGLTFGDSGRNYLNNPSRTNFNASLFKHFKPFGEGQDLEFRAEAYNVFNHTQFRIYDPTHPGNTGNNVVNCYGSQTEFYSAGASSCLVGNSFLHPVDAHDPRILQFGMKLAF